MRLFHQIHAESDRVRIAPSREIDLAVQAELRSVLSGVVATATGPVELDLHEVTFLDCSGVNEFVRAYVHALRRGCALTVSGARGVVRLVLEASGALPVLTAEQPTAAPPAVVRPRSGITRAAGRSPARCRQRHVKR